MSKVFADNLSSLHQGCHLGEPKRKWWNVPCRAFQTSMNAQPYFICAKLCTIYADKKLLLFQGERGGSVTEVSIGSSKRKKIYIKKKQFPQAKYRSRNGEELDVSITFTWSIWLTKSAAVDHSMQLPPPSAFSPTGFSPVLIKILVPGHFHLLIVPQFPHTTL